MTGAGRPPARRPARSLARLLVWAALVVVNLAAVAFFLLSFGPHGVGFGPYRIDLDVYQIGGRVWLGGGDLYWHLPPTQAGARLPFTYPPIAAVLLAPLARLPMAVAGTVITLVSVALLAAVLRLVLGRLVPGRMVLGRTGWLLPAALLPAALLPVALFLEPVRSTLGFGQVNVILMALVCFDCLLAGPRWPRGALVGLAAAVKLTPAAFVLYFLLRRDYRAAATAGLSFAVATAAGFALDWHDSVRYWTSEVFQVGRVGSPAYAGNQSILAVLARAGVDPRTQAGTVAWLALSGAVLVVAAWGMRRALDAGEEVLALCLNAQAALLISPISWSHHWVWCAPTIVALAVIGRRRRAWLALAAAAAGLVIFATSPQWWFPRSAGRELRWAPWEQVAGSSYVIFGALVLVLAACGLLARAGQLPSAGALRPIRPPARPVSVTPTPAPAPVTGSATGSRLLP